jgi:hypothetical protein
VSAISTKERVRCFCFANPSVQRRAETADALAEGPIHAQIRVAEKILVVKYLFFGESRSYPHINTNNILNIHTGR